MNPRVRQVTERIAQLPGFGDQEIQVIIRCDCWAVPVGHGTVGRLSGDNVLDIKFCLKASLSHLDEQLHGWCKENKVLELYDCKYGTFYNPVLNS